MMLSYRKADIFQTIKYRDIEVTVLAKVGESKIPTEGYFVLFERPKSENETVRESMDARLRGILEAKSYIKVGDMFWLPGCPSKERAEQEFSDVLRLLRSHNSILSLTMDPYTWIPGTRVKQFLIRMKTRG
jgi:hypothetical protein